MTLAKRRIFSAEIASGQAPGPAEGRSPADHDAWLRHREILAAIAALGTAPPPAAADDLAEKYSRGIAEASDIRAELQNLSSAIENTKREIAAVRYRDTGMERIVDVACELDAIIADTEDATQSILGTCEQIEGHLDLAELQTASPEERATLQDISSSIIKIYEACNFQDISGQRITKVVNTLKYIEERIEAMMTIWGGDAAFASVPLPEPERQTSEAMLLNGPARPGDVLQGDTVSQADIDALFG